MARLQDPSITEVHVHTARQAWIEAANRAHDIDTLEAVGPIFFEQRGVLDGVLEGSRRAERVARTGIPGRRRIRVVIGDLAIADDQMMRQPTAYGFVEAAADRFI